MRIVAFPAALFSTVSTGVCIKIRITSNPNDTKGSKKLLIELFKNQSVAKHAYWDLLNKGYEKDDITLMMSEETEKITLRIKTFQQLI